MFDVTQQDHGTQDSFTQQLLDGHYEHHYEAQDEYEQVELDQPDDNDVPAFMQALAGQQADIQATNDGDLIKIHPSKILDMKCGNLFKRKSSTPELKADIKEHGIIQPVIVRPHPEKPGFFELIGGYGRRDIAAELDILVPANVRHVDDKTAILMHRSENMLRSGHSFGDEVRIAKEWLSHFAGDRATAQAKSGWSVTKFNERVEMLKATDAVLEALDEGKITVKHAFLLSSFSEEVQNNTLKKVIDEKWAVAVLKERADKVTVPLSLAIFDTAECDTCPHNTERQRGLFEMSDVEQKCAKSSCFKGKTDAELQVRKSAAEERFGKVIFLSETVQADRVTVRAENVGQEQFESGCTGCSNNVVMLNDKMGDKTGALYENQCIDSACYSKCVSAQKAHVEALAAQEQPETEAGTEAGTEAAQGTKAAKKAKAPAAVKKEVVVGSYTQPAIQAHQAELRRHAAAHLANNAHFAEAMKAYSLMNVAGCKTKNHGSTLLKALMAKTPEELVKVQQDAIAYLLNKSGTINNVAAWNFITAGAKSTDDGEAALVAAWKPEQATMDKYTTIQLEQLAKQSGLAEAQAEAYKKAASGKKADVVNMVAGSESKGFDWTSFAPAPYLAELAKA